MTELTALVWAPKPPDAEEFGSGSGGQVAPKVRQKAAQAARLAVPQEQTPRSAGRAVVLVPPTAPMAPQKPGQAAALGQAQPMAAQAVWQGQPTALVEAAAPPLAGTRWAAQTLLLTSQVPQLATKL